MTKRAFAAIDRRVSAFQERIGLNGWSIQRYYYADDHLPEGVRSDSAGDSCVGTAEAWAEVEQAELHVACDSDDHPPDEIARHELLHVLLSPMEAAVNRLREQVGAGAWEVAFGAYKDAEELAVRRLTRAFGDEDGEEPATSDDE